MIDRDRLVRLHQRGLVSFAERNPKSAIAYENATHLFGKVPMTWMIKKVGGFPLYLATARGNRVTDLDGHEYLDFALGDTGASAGHSPAGSGSTAEASPSPPPTRTAGPSVSCAPSPTGRKSSATAAASTAAPTSR